jgi:hypothetical protein
VGSKRRKVRSRLRGTPSRGLALGAPKIAATKRLRERDYRSSETIDGFELPGAKTSRVSGRFE